MGLEVISPPPDRICRILCRARPLLFAAAFPTHIILRPQSVVLSYHPDSFHQLVLDLAKKTESGAGSQSGARLRLFSTPCRSGVADRLFSGDARWMETAN